MRWNAMYLVVPVLALGVSIGCRQAEKQSSDAQTAETDTSFTLPDSAIVHDVMLNVITVDATETVDVGTAGT